MSDNEATLLNSGLALERSARFSQAKSLYEDMLAQVSDEKVIDAVRIRLDDVHHLIAEREVYRRIDENAKRVLTEIGMNLAGSQALMDMLLEADAIDFESESALFVPLKRSYVERCLEQVPRALPRDPGRNAFGTGSTSPFLKRAGAEELRPAGRKEYEQIVCAVAEQQDVVDIFSLPVACDRSVSLFEVARLMEGVYPGLKMIPTNTMADDEVTYFRGREDWIDGTSLVAALTPMNNMVEPFVRSARSGNTLLLIDQTIAGITGPGSPEALLTQIHAQVLFMMVVAQTVRPGVPCVHGGLPSVAGTDGGLAYSSPSQSLVNAALARVNTWITGFPSAQTGGSTSLAEPSPRAAHESELSRNLLRKCGVHIVRHAMGALGSLNFFSVEKFLEDCERERRSREVFSSCRNGVGVIPLFFPGDGAALEGICEIAERGNPKFADHTLSNVDAFDRWEKRIKDAAGKRPYCPQLNDPVLEAIGGAAPAP